MDLIEGLVDLLSVRFHIEECAHVFDIGFPRELLHDIVKFLLQCFVEVNKLYLQKKEHKRII